MIQNATRANVQRIIVKSAQEKMPQFHRHWHVMLTFLILQVIKKNTLEE